MELSFPLNFYENDSRYKGGRLAKKPTAFVQSHINHKLITNVSQNALLYYKHIQRKDG